MAAPYLLQVVGRFGFYVEDEPLFRKTFYPVGMSVPSPLVFLSLNHTKGVFFKLELI